VGKHLLMVVVGFVFLVSGSIVMMKKKKQKQNAHSNFNEKYGQLL